MSTPKTFEVSREDIERYASIGFELAIATLYKNGVITEEEAKEYYDYTCTSVTNKSVTNRLLLFFGKDVPSHSLSFKFAAIKLENKPNE